MNVLDYIEKMKEMYEGPRITAQEPRNMYAGGQLVRNTVDGSRPGYAKKKKYDFSAPRPHARINPDRVLTWQEKEVRRFAKHGPRHKTTKIDFIFEGNKISIDVPYMKPESKGLMKELLKGVEKWKVDPTTENWVKIFRKPKKSGPSYKGPKQYSHGWSADLRKYIQGKETTNPLTKNIFDQLDIKKTLGLSKDEVKMIKSYVDLKDMTIAGRIADEKKLRKSFENIIEINKHFKTNPNMDLDQLTKKIYKSAFTKADDAGKLRMTTSVSDDVAKYLEALKGSREIPKGLKSQWKPPTGKNLDFITDRIFDQTKGFRFQDFTMRKYKYSIRDSMLNLRPGTTYNLEKTLKLTKGVLDHTVGLSATFDIAPGYTELYQNLEAAANTAKGNKIDKPFGEALRAALTKGDFSKVDAYNKIALAWQKKNPGVDVPFIRKGGNPKELISYFDDLSPEAQKNVLKIAGGKEGLAIETKGRPIKTMKDMMHELNVGKSTLAYHTLKKGDIPIDNVCFKGKVKKASGGRIGYKSAGVVDQVCGIDFAQKKPNEFLKRISKMKGADTFLRSAAGLKAAKGLLGTARYWASPITLGGGEAWYSYLAYLNERGKGKSMASSINEGLWFIPGKTKRDMEMLAGYEDPRIHELFPDMSKEGFKGMTDDQKKMVMAMQLGQNINKQEENKMALAINEYTLSGNNPDMPIAQISPHRDLTEQQQTERNVLEARSKAHLKGLREKEAEGEELFKKYATLVKKSEGTFSPSDEQLWAPFKKLKERTQEQMVSEFNKSLPKKYMQGDPWSGPVWSKTKSWFGRGPFGTPIGKTAKEEDMLKKMDAKERYLYNVNARGLGYLRGPEDLTAKHYEDYYSRHPYLEPIFNKGGRVGYTDGGLTRTVAPDSGPMSQGLRSLYINDRDY